MWVSSGVSQEEYLARRALKSFRLCLRLVEVERGRGRLVDGLECFCCVKFFYCLLFFLLLSCVYRVVRCLPLILFAGFFKALDG